MTQSFNQAIFYACRFEYAFPRFICYCKSYLEIAHYFPFFFSQPRNKLPLLLIGPVTKTDEKVSDKKPNPEKPFYLSSASNR